MNRSELEREAAGLQDSLTEIRHDLHAHPGAGFDVEYALNRVGDELAKMGIAYRRLGKAGVIADLGDPDAGKTLILRADMDALPMDEEADVPFKSTIPGRMHGCGHDMHTTMLLGAAKILKAHESQLQGRVRLMFQPAEEIFQGARDMIENGALEGADAAFMIHVLAGMDLPDGAVLVPGGGITMASCEQYEITVKGKGGHGSMPAASIDPITAACQIHLGLQEINSRELEGGQYGVFTTGLFQAGNASNVIPDKAVMKGTIRTVDEDNAAGKLIKKRMQEISEGFGKAMRCEVEVSFHDYCPCMIVDPTLAAQTMKIMREYLGPMAIDLAAVTGGKAGGGSEDFAFVSHELPAVNVLLGAGSPADGYCYAQHHPKVRFKDSVLEKGAALYAWMGLKWLEEQKGIREAA